ncbi:MAG: hypothetical protein C4527_03990, partial [Candidatus Omnitrophota bacterium]
DWKTNTVIDKTLLKKWLKNITMNGSLFERCQQHCRGGKNGIMDINAMASMPFTIKHTGLIHDGLVDGRCFELCQE